MEPNNGTAPISGGDPMAKGSNDDFRREGIDIVGQGVSDTNDYSPKEPAALKEAPLEKPEDRSANIMSARSVFETNRRIEEAFAASAGQAPAQKPASRNFIDAAPASNTTNSLPVPPQPAAPVPQKPMPITPVAQSTPKPVTETPAPLSEPKAPEAPAFHRVSFGVAPNMPKEMEESAQTAEASAPLAPKPEQRAGAIIEKIPPQPIPGAPASAQPSFSEISKTVQSPIPPKPSPAPESQKPPKPPEQRAPAPRTTPPMPNPDRPEQKPQPAPLSPSPKIPTPGELASSAPGPKNDPSIKPIRTFKSDAEEAVRYQNVSAIDIAVAEQKKKEVSSTPIEYEEAKKSHAGAFVVGAIAIIGLLGAGWYFWMRSSNPLGQVSPEPISGSVSTISADMLIPYQKVSAVVIEPGSSPLNQISAQLALGNASLGNVHALVPVLNATSTQIAPPTSLFGMTRIPSRLLRSLGSDYMIGTYVMERQAPFMILSNTYFENAFAGMLEWEPDIASDFEPLISIAHPGEKTASSASFEDAVISNLDARVINNEKGEMLLGYAFIGKDTVVIATSEEAMKHIIEKLLAVRTIQ